MKYNLKPLKDQVMVITGASSGIGLATAFMASEKGAKVVLVSRNEEVLKEIVNKIRLKNGKAIYVVADVCEQSQLLKVATNAIGEFGRIDTWVNSAGTSIWGFIEDINENDMRRLFDINFWGTVNGSLVALNYLRKNGGVIVNIGSIASDVVLPIQGIYSATKHALKAFTDSLRIELIHNKTPIAVSLIKPASIGTPLTQKVKNYTPKDPRLLSPIYDPKAVAKAILSAAQTPTRDIYVGGSAPILAIISKMFPRIVDKLSAKFIINSQLANTKKENHAGNLNTPASEGQIYGDYPDQIIVPSIYTRLIASSPACKVMLLGAGSLVLFSFLKKLRHKI